MDHFVSLREAVEQLVSDAQFRAAEDAGLGCWVATNRTPPFTIQRASLSWHCHWGFSTEDVKTRSISVLNGTDFDANAATTARRKATSGECDTIRCRNTSKYEAVYSHDLKLVPCSDGCLGVLTNFTLEATSPLPPVRCLGWRLPGVPREVDVAVRHALASIDVCYTHHDNHIAVVHPALQTTDTSDETVHFTITIVASSTPRCAGALPVHAQLGWGARPYNNPTCFTSGG
jgi:hypothetical protein